MQFLKAVIPVTIVLILTWAISGFLKATKPSAGKRSIPSAPPAVDVITVSPGSYQITIRTRGEVRPRTRSVLIPEVSGTIVRVSDQFRDGGFFEEGDILLEIDPRDYVTALAIAASNVAEAENALEQEKARAEQAVANWKRLGKGTPASPLVLREPQMNEAKARLAAVMAQQEQAQTDLERTKIKAPYAGRIREQLVDEGQFVNTGTSLARIYAVDFAEVRLPLTNRQSGFIDLPESFRGENPNQDASRQPGVTLTKQQASRQFRWEGKIVRTEGTIDTRSRQLFVVAEVEGPYDKRPDGTPPLKIGDFVEAEIEGQLLEGVYTIPRSAIRGSGQLLTVDAQQQLRITDVEIVWGDEDNVLVRGGLSPGDVICLTPPAFATEGAKVEPIPARSEEAENS